MSNQYPPHPPDNSYGQPPYGQPPYGQPPSYGGYQQPPSNPPPTYQTPPSGGGKGGGMGKWLLITALVVGGFFVLCCVGGFAGLAYLEAEGLDTMVVSGNQIPSKHMNKIRVLGLVERDEQILHFYSDAILDLAGGAYLATDRRIVLYDNEWPKPKIVIPYSEIVRLEIVESQNELYEDSIFTIHVKDGQFYTFPVSAEAGGDKRFLQTIEQRAVNSKETKKMLSTSR
ncbi:MAG: hypothetical protein PWP23_2139 [Candidatus Sumerlaeota bacterium]|nr:hypothetical protein [Candidatus Sumerlaeota bacterium]